MDIKSFVTIQQFNFKPSPAKLQGFGNGTFLEILATLARYCSMYKPILTVSHRKL